ncbi:MAG: DNA-processing protein DprA [Cellvibrionaceae bacterium]
MDSEIHPQELLANLVLQRLPDFGPGRYWQLRQHYRDARAILQAPAAELGKYLGKEACDEVRRYQRGPSKHSLSQQAVRDLAWLDENQVALLTPEHSHYPSLLQNIHSRPPLLFVRGNLENLALPQLAIVGSRNPSPTGSDNAFEFARQLSRTGFVVTSGLALGIDGAAHRGALDAGGKTIAVLGTGIDQIYPHRHRRLGQQLLAEGGTLISEFPLGTSAQPGNFPRRNRIISGMSVGVLVVEAAVKSGSLITARYAMQQGREVFAIPGSIHNPLSRGCHVLLRDGATLVEQIDDLREPLQGLLALMWDQSRPVRRQAPAEKLDEETELVLTNLGYEPTAADTLVARTGLDIGRILSLLTMLELKGLVQQTASGYQREAKRTA